MKSVCSIAVLGCLAAGAVTAEVRIVERPDGTKYVYNVKSPRQARAVRPRTQGALSEPAAEELRSMIDRYARQASLDEKLVRAVVQAESAFDPRALSHKGAMGLMQLMPATAAAFGVTDPYDPEQNVRAGTRYLKRMIDTFGSLELGLAAYNAGPSAVKRFQGVPPYPETRGYVEKVIRLFRGDGSYTLAGSRHLRPGRKTYLLRDDRGRLVMTTSPPGS